MAIKVDITDDKKYLMVNPDTMFEFKQLELSFTRKVENAYAVEKVAPWLPSEKCFYNTDYQALGVNHWLQLIKVAKDYALPLAYSDKFKSYLAQFDLSKEEFAKFVDDLFKGAVNDKGMPFYPYDYQIDAAYALLKYKRATAEISTSGGKTLISYIIFKYLYEAKGIEYMFYIVPSVDLGTQTIEKYELYDSFLAHECRDWSGAVLKAGLKKSEKRMVDSCNLLFATYQSLCKKPADFFTKFRAQIVDECHHTVNNSIRTILDKATSLEYSMGVTGTFPKDDSFNYMLLTSLLGPMVYKFSSYQLIYEKKTGTPIYVVMVIMDYASEEEKQNLYMSRLSADKTDASWAMKLLKEEQMWINSNEERMRYIGRMACETKTNTLVLFGDIKYGYGKRLHQYIKMSCDKDVFYCDGETPTNVRDYYKQKMLEDSAGNTIIVASIGVFGEGIDVPNLGVIFLVNTVKSERLVRQILGRGLRKSEGKEQAVMFDFVDDLRYGAVPARDNYMWKHQRSRRKIYEEHKFPVYEMRPDMSKIRVNPLLDSK